MRRRSPGFEQLTREELRTRANQRAQEVFGVPTATEAFARLNRGELRGTMAEAELRSLEFALKATRR